ncbi:MAG: cupin domain-containing protein [Actinobacteria bacterium]|nr:MAG: cupin domain-containing protein [Actinomycetota bacterium]
MNEGETVSLGRYGTAMLVRTAPDPQADAVEFEFRLGPRSPGPPPHRHPHQEERWEVLEGTLDARVDGTPRRLSAGESIAIAPGTAHGFRNRGEEPLRFRDVHLPARGFQRYIEQLAAILGQGRARDPRTLLRIARLVAAQGDDQRPATRPGRIALSAAAGIARLLGLGVPGPARD